jgi:hypothetical protein
MCVCGRISHASGCSFLPGRGGGGGGSITCRQEFTVRLERRRREIYNRLCNREQDTDSGRIVLYVAVGRKGYSQGHNNINISSKHRNQTQARFMWQSRHCNSFFSKSEKFRFFRAMITVKVSNFVILLEENTFSPKFLKNSPKNFPVLKSV